MRGGLFESWNEISDSLNHESRVCAGNPNSLSVDDEEDGGSDGDADDVEEFGEFGVALVDLGVHDVGVLFQDALDLSLDVVVCCPEHLVDGVRLVEEHEVNVVIVTLKVVQRII